LVISGLGAIHAGPSLGNNHCKEMRVRPAKHWKLELLTDEVATMVGGPKKVLNAPLVSFPKMKLHSPIFLPVRIEMRT
jgi:hypothetical protein